MDYAYRVWHKLHQSLHQWTNNLLKIGWFGIIVSVLFLLKFYFILADDNMLDVDLARLDSLEHSVTRIAHLRTLKFDWAIL